MGTRLLIITHLCYELRDGQTVRLKLLDIGLTQTILIVYTARLKVLSNIHRFMACLMKLHYFFCELSSFDRLPMRLD